MNIIQLTIIDKRIPKKTRLLSLVLWKSEIEGCQNQNPIILKKTQRYKIPAGSGAYPATFV